MNYLWNILIIKNPVICSTNHLYETNDKENKNTLVNVINSDLKDLKEEIKKIPEEERNIEKPDKIVNLVEERFLILINKNKKGKA